MLEVIFLTVVRIKEKPNYWKGAGAIRRGERKMFKYLNSTEFHKFTPAGVQPPSLNLNWSFMWYKQQELLIWITCVSFLRSCLKVRTKAELRFSPQKVKGSIHPISQSTDTANRCWGQFEKLHCYRTRALLRRALLSSEWKHRSLFC